MADETPEVKRPVQRVTFKATAIFEHDDYAKRSFNFAGSYRPDGEAQAYERSAKVGTSAIPLTKLIPPGFVDSPGMIIVHVVKSVGDAPNAVKVLCEDSNHGLLATEDFPLVIQLEDFTKWNLIATQPNTVVTITAATR